MTTDGYQVGVSSNGTTLSLFLNGIVTPINIPLGTLSADFYEITMSMIGSEISVSVFRAVDGMWLSPDGSWVSFDRFCIQVNDTTYQAIGRVLIGGIWGPVATPLLYNDNGVLGVTDEALWPPAGSLPPGSFYSNHGLVSVVLGGTPIAGDPIFFQEITASDLLGTDGNTLPIVAPTAGSNQLWNNLGLVHIA